MKRLYSKVSEINETEADQDKNEVFVYLSFKFKLIKFLLLKRLYSSQKAHCIFSIHFSSMNNNNSLHESTIYKVNLVSLT